MRSTLIIIGFLAICGGLLTGAFARETDKPEMPRYHAIVIGINEYEKKPPLGWESLTTARQDAEAVAEVLEVQYGFQVTRLLDKQATRDGIIQALDKLKAFTADDAVLIYFGGHGMFDEQLADGYWIPCDARRLVGSSLPNADWVWNSQISKLIEASKARHILVIADSCFSGSLFRGVQIELNSARFDQGWYRRALEIPSRYLITSGNVEPVLDTGYGHSIFAQKLLDFLRFTEKPVFSVTELGLAVRDEVCKLAKTRQMPRMGPLNVSSHAGGEFVFIQKNAQLPLGASSLPGLALATTRGASRFAVNQPWLGWTGAILVVMFCMSALLYYVKVIKKGLALQTVTGAGIVSPMMPFASPIVISELKSHFDRTWEAEERMVELAFESVDGPFKGQSYLVKASAESGDEVIIGSNRTDKPDWVLSDGMVSKLHAKIVFRDENGKSGSIPSQLKPWIVEIKSRNGLFVNGSKVTNSLLKAGDLIRIGQSTFKLRDVKSTRAE